MNVIDQLVKLNKDATIAPWLEWYAITNEDSYSKNTNQFIQGCGPPHKLNDDGILQAQKDSELINTMRNNIYHLINVAIAAYPITTIQFEDMNIFERNRLIEKLAIALAELERGE